MLSIDPSESRANANLLTIFKQTGEFQAAQALIDGLNQEQRQHPDIRKAIADLKIAEGDNMAISNHLADLASSNPEPGRELAELGFQPQKPEIHGGVPP